MKQSYDFLWAIELLFFVMLIVRNKYLSIQLKESKKLTEETRRVDPLTGLYNKRALNEFGQTAFVSAKRNKKSLAVLFIDLDNFKKINDILGHLVGDKILIKFAEVLRTAVGINRGVDLISRNGGDEFTVVLTDSNKDHAEKVKNSIKTEFKRVFIKDVYGKTFPHLFDCSFRVSIGIATCPGEQEVHNFESLLKFADIAMYKIKELSRGEDIIKIMRG